MECNCGYVCCQQDDPVPPKSWIWNVGGRRRGSVFENIWKLDKVSSLGRIWSLGYRVTRERIRSAVRFLDPLSTALCWHGNPAYRRPYSVPGPNSLWHIGKVLRISLLCNKISFCRWWLVTHGGIDGYSRMIVYLCCSTNNRSDTVLRLFVAATEQIRLPSRVRSDLGGENVKVAQYMPLHRGRNKRSMITGSSTHNQCIERLWCNVHKSVTFYFLEQQTFFNPLNELDIFALHYVFLG